MMLAIVWLQYFFWSDQFAILVVYAATTVGWKYVARDVGS